MPRSLYQQSSWRLGHIRENFNDLNKMKLEYAKYPQKWEYNIQDYRHEQINNSAQVSAGDKGKPWEGKI